MSLTKKSLIIGFAGQKRSGKDTCVNTLTASKDLMQAIFGTNQFARELIYSYYTLAFASAIRDLVGKLYSLLELQVPLDEDKEKETFLGRSYRHLQKTLGTEWGREMISPDLWMEIVRKRIKTNNCSWLISDVRFENEAKMIRGMGGYIVKVVRPGHENDEQHPSEAGFPDELVHITLINDGTLNDFQTAVLMMERWLVADLHRLTPDRMPKIKYSALRGKVVP